MNFTFPPFSPASLEKLIPTASAEAITLIMDMLRWNPGKRPTAQQALRWEGDAVLRTGDNGRSSGDVRGFSRYMPLVLIVRDRCTMRVVKSGRGENV